MSLPSSSVTQAFHYRFLIVFKDCYHGTVFLYVRLNTSQIRISHCEIVNVETYSLSRLSLDVKWATLRSKVSEYCTGEVSMFLVQ